MTELYESMVGLHIIMSQNILLKSISIIGIKYSVYHYWVFVSSIKQIFWKLKKITSGYKITLLFYIILLQGEEYFNQSTDMY